MSAKLQSAQVSDKPIWTPTPQSSQNSDLALFMRSLGKDGQNYQQFWQWSVDHMEDFWSAFWDYAGIIGTKGNRILVDGDKMPGAHFFPDASLNYAENMLKKRDDSTAVIFRDEKKRERTLTFKELYDDVSRCAQFLKASGLKAGDRVAGLMPNMPETLIAMLAASSIGAVWSSASPDFGVQGALDRFGQIEPKIFIAPDGYFYNGKSIDCLAKVAELQTKLPSVEKILIVPFITETPDISGIKLAQNWTSTLKTYGAQDITFVRLPFNHPLFIMFSSGTTGVPKCIVHGQGGTLLEHVKEHRLHCDVKPGDKVFYFTTCGWMMWNWQMTALASGATLMLYDGSPFYPTGLVLWDYAARHNCTLFGTAAKYIDALRSNNIRPKEGFDLSSIRTLASTGSPLVHESFDFIYDAIKRDIHVASISGGTDIISCFVLGNPISPVYRGEIQCASLGFDVDIFDDQGRPMPAGAGSGELVCKKPFPCMPIYFWNDADQSKYKKAYFERFDNIWCHGDFIERTAHDGLIIHGRSDATLKPGGVRIGTAEIYRQVEQVPEVFESIAVGQDWDNDVRVILFVKLKDGFTLNDDITTRIKTKIRTGASPRHVPAKILQVTDIPRTKSNKIVELAVRDVIHGRPIKNVEALANPEALELYKNLEALKS